MNYSKSKRFAASICMMGLAILVSQMVSNLVLHDKFRLLLVPGISLLVCLPFILWFWIKDKQQIEKEKRKLEEKFAAQDAELLSQTNKHHG